MSGVKKNTSISIVIPTYNRAELLDYTLGKNICVAEKNNIAIYIFDNSSTDTTENIVKKRAEEYSLIYYYRHETNIGPDSNFEFALKYPETDYVWLLGDTYLIPPNSIDWLLKLIILSEKKYDMFLLNIENHIKEKPECDYEDRNLLFEDLFWLTNCMSCLIYGRELIEHANFTRYRDTNFIQTGIIFEYISDKDFKIKWLPGFSIKIIEEIKDVKKVGWQENIFKIWFERRANFIFSLPPSYRLDLKIKLVKETHVYSKTSWTSFFRYRAEGIFNYSIYKKYRYLLPVLFDKIVIIWAASITPRIIIIKAKKFHLNFLKFKKKFKGDGNEY